MGKSLITIPFSSQPCLITRGEIKRLEKRSQLVEKARRQPAPSAPSARDSAASGVYHADFYPKNDLRIAQFQMQTSNKNNYLHQKKICAMWKWIKNIKDNKHLCVSSNAGPRIVPWFRIKIVDGKTVLSPLSTVPRVSPRATHCWNGFGNLATGIETPVKNQGKVGNRLTNLGIIELSIFAEPKIGTV